MKKSPTFLYAAIWLHLAHFWMGLKYICKAKYKTLGNRYIYIVITFPSHLHLVFSKHLFFFFKKISFWENSFIMNKHNQKPTGMFNKQNVTAYLTFIKRLKG